MNGADEKKKRLRQVLEKHLQEMQVRSGEPDFSMRTGYPFMIGLYLAVNAIRDAYLLVEGPDCSYMKTQYIQGNHDWLSTLTSVSGFHRVANTALHPSLMTDSREAQVTRAMEGMLSRPAVAALLLTSMPMASVTAVDYDRLCRDVSGRFGRQVLHVPGRSLSGDWLDGYAETLKAVAKQLPLPEKARQPKKVALVGYLFDRNEDDHQANLAELRLMLEALGLELVSVWLSGQKWSELEAVAEAGTIISLPYGRMAAKILARRTGAELVELPLPFGPQACELWLRELGRRFDAEQAAARYLERHMAEIAPRLEWVVPFLFQNLEAGYIGDPHLLAGFKDILELLGGKLRFAVITNRPAAAKEIGAEVGETRLVVHPRLREFLRVLLEELVAHDIRLLLTNNYGVSLPLATTAVVEFGFPSVYRHALFDRPFLTHRGFLAFVDTLANAVHQQMLRASLPPLDQPQGEG